MGSDRPNHRRLAVGYLPGSLCAYRHEALPSSRANGARGQHQVGVPVRERIAASPGEGMAEELLSTAAVDSTDLLSDKVEANSSNVR